MRVRVRSRAVWDEDLRDEFGEENSIHELSASQIVTFIIKFGCAELSADAEGLYTLEFHNDYD